MNAALCSVFGKSDIRIRTGAPLLLHHQVVDNFGSATRPSCEATFGEPEVTLPPASRLLTMAFAHVVIGI